MISIDRCIAQLSEISKRKAASFYEQRVADYVTTELTNMGIPFEIDDAGNIIANYVGPSAEGKTPFALVAHMDHPAFEITDPEGREGRLLGFVRAECFENPVSILVYPRNPELSVECEQGVPGTVTGCTKTGDETTLNLQLDGVCPALPAFGVWDILDMEVSGDMVHLRAADDLAGCAAILLVLAEAKSRRLSANIIGTFTRAEEVGLLGSIYLAQSGRLPKETIVVSLETSKTLPGAEIGGGPVIRVGDAKHTFDDAAECLLRQAHYELKQENPEIKVQRQLMSGGSCEATVFVLAGYRTTGMALPLGNYHNVTPEMTLAPEYISASDLATEVELLLRASVQTSEECRSAVWGRIDKRSAEGIERLKQSSIS